VILVSKHLGTDLHAGINKIVMPNGVDVNIFKPMNKDLCRRRLKWQNDIFIIIFVASMAQHTKRYELACEAVKIAEKSARCRLEVVWGIEHEEMPIYMNAADALILTSVSEGSPNVVKEAIACGLPVVTVPVGDVRERLRNVPGSVVCENDSAETIAEGILSVYGYTRMHGRPPFVPEAVVDEAENTQRLLKIYRLMTEMKDMKRKERREAIKKGF
jgi:glycosyltransferase involved in cell wall biosynthesis